MKNIVSLWFLLLISNVASGQVCHDARNHPDYVPDAKTAEAIAKAVLIARFGDDSFPTLANAVEHVMTALVKEKLD